MKHPRRRIVSCRSNNPAACLVVGLYLLAASVAGCSHSRQDREALPGNVAPEALDLGVVTDAAYLTAAQWDDGQAEVAFYHVHRTLNQYDEPEDQDFLVGTYVVKHDYDPFSEAKAEPNARGRIASFKYALFYEIESGSYQYKRSYVVHARQNDLRPLKHSFTSFDWCSNLYREQAFAPGGRVTWLVRSDDYENRAGAFDYEDRTYPPALLPMLFRGMDFGRVGEHRFGVVLESGDVVTATAHRSSVESIQTKAGLLEAERIQVAYDGEVPSPFAERSDRSEIWWRSTGDDRALLAVEGASGRYRMELVEVLRSPYWEENVYDRLERVEHHP